VSTVIGIDLGTSNTVAAVADRTSARVVSLQQYTDVNETEGLLQLPSVLYHSLPEESFPAPPQFASLVADHPTALDKRSTEDSGSASEHHTALESRWVVGAFARKRGSEVPERVIASAKSWLCHAGVDRNAAILPWVSHRDTDENAQATLERLSPVDASAAVLRHVKRGLLQAGLHVQSDTTVVITVPASFDQVARQLTLEAATRAGLNAKLLEEPQAAFYDWLHRATPLAIERLLRAGKGSRVLIVDVGGGTTDLTLLQVQPRDGLRSSELVTLPLHERVDVDRLAVGRHLLLGGDNIDLTLAHLVERRFELEKEKRLTPSEFAQLVAACQRAKERLLGGDPPQSAAIRLVRRGARLVGNTLQSQLTRNEVEALVFEGFLPKDPLRTPLKRRNSALVGFGLPFESDPAITHHLGQFLSEHGANIDAVLFNGGFFRSPAICGRLLDILTEWSGHPIEQLPHAEPDFAVAAGAVYYGLALGGTGLRFTGGSALGYYVGAQTHAGSQKGVCVIPKGALEDQIFRVDTLPLTLALGKTVSFSLFANRIGKHNTGDVVELDTPGFEHLPPLRTRLDASSPEGSVPVLLQGALSAVGTLDVACVETVPPHRKFELAFELRHTTSADTLVPARASVARPASTQTTVGASLVNEAHDVLHRVFGKGRKDVTPRDVKDLWRDLERLLGMRKDWDLALNRSLADTLLTLASGRRRSVDHERLYFAMTGFCLRPGIGHTLDPDRLKLFEPLFEPGILFHADRPTLDQFFVAWRRVAAGLSESTQTQIRTLCDPLIAPAEQKLKKSKTFRAAETPLVWDLLSWLERVSPEQRGLLGQWVLERTWTKRDPQNWEWLGRIGAREPTYASAHHVVRTRQVEAWLEHLLSEHWDTHPAPSRNALIGAGIALARCTNDRSRDINDMLRERVAARLSSVGADTDAVEAVRHFAPSTRIRTQAYGDDLPPGLQLSERT
jgi:molecular chaperone DnaK (HSP70)